MNIIAVMFTFSFSSAFATVEKGDVDEGKAQIAVAQDFYVGENEYELEHAKTLGTLAGDYGTVGVTTQTREELLDEIDGYLEEAAGFDSTFDYIMPYGTPMAYYDHTGAFEFAEGWKAYNTANENAYKELFAAEFRAVFDAAKEVGKTTPTEIIKHLAADITGPIKGFIQNYDFEWNETTDSYEAYEDFMSNAEAAELTEVWTDAKKTAETATTAADIVEAIEDAQAAADKITAKYVAYEKQIVANAKLNVSAKLLDGAYLVPNYGRFTFTSLSKKYPVSSLTPNEQHAVICWLLDNGYTTKASFEEGTAKFVEALVPYSTWSKDYEAELKAIGTKITNVNQSLLFAKSTETKLADVAALYEEIAAFEAKYAVTTDLLAAIAKKGIDLELIGIAPLLQKEVASTVLANADAIKALNKVKNTMTAEEEAEAIVLAKELYANFDALYEDYEDILNYIYPVKVDGEELRSAVGGVKAVTDIERIKKAIETYKTGFSGVIYPDFKQAGELNLETVLLYALNMDAFTLLARVEPLIASDKEAVEKAIGKVSEAVFTPTKVESKKTKKTKYVIEKAGFTATTANLANIAAAEDAVEEFFATYGNLVEVYFDGDDETEYLAAKLLAAKYNAVALGYVDPQPTAAEKAAAQAVLDNATVKVTTQALGNGKIRVQAKLDDDTWAYIKGTYGDKAATLAKAPKYTVEYKFYKKKAADKKYKGYSDKKVNYTVFKNLKKGTKYNFRCAVTLKDANGNVVATRAFTGSTKGTRTAK